MALSVPNSHHSGQGQLCLQVQTNRVHASPLLAAGNKTPQYLSLIQAKERKKEPLKGLKATLQPYKDLTSLSQITTVAFTAPALHLHRIFQPG